MRRLLWIVNIILGLVSYAVLGIVLLDLSLSLQANGF